MGNPAMPIDRYDVRGLLSDLSKYEAKNLDPNLKYSDYLSPEDALVIWLFLKHDSDCALFA